jgi:ferritin-like metal-binding protein YciE
MKMESLKELYVEELKDLYSAENQIIKALPKMIKAASSRELKQGFRRAPRADKTPCSATGDDL